MKKLISSIIIGSIAFSGCAFADYSLTVHNNSTVPVSINPQGLQKTEVPAGETSEINLSTGRNVAVTYTSNGGQPQGIANLFRPTNTFGVGGNRYASPAPGRQNLNVSINNGQGTFTTGPGSLSGICQVDTTQSGFWCPTNTSDNGGSLTLTISGGTKPTPVENYVFPAYPSGNSEVTQWDANTQYGVYHPGNLHDRVSYQGAEWVACYYAPKGETPGSNPAWKEFNPAKNVCNG